MAAHIVRRFLKRVVKNILYIIRFGPVTGLLLLLLLRNFCKQLPKGTLVRVPCDRKGHSVLLRSGTTDQNIFEQTWLFNAVNVPKYIGITPRTIIDGGAHIGCTTIAFRQQFPQARVIAIEAEFSNYKLMEQNVGRDVTAIHAAIVGTDETVFIDSEIDETYAFRVARSAQTNINEKQNCDQVRGCRIDTLLNEINLDSVDLLKLDIEGSERDVFLKDPDRWLKCVHAIMIELHDRFEPGCHDAFVSAIERCGFTIVSEWRHNLLAVRRS